MTQISLARLLASFAAEPMLERDRQTLDQEITDRLRDHLGVCLAAVDSEPATAVARVVEDRGGAPQVGLIGRPGHYPAALAGLYNGTLAHALDFDDTHLPSVLHPSAAVLAAALSAAVVAQAPGSQFIRAASVGLEICVRLGMTGYDVGLRDSVFFAKGLHATSICGSVGAAAAASVAFGLDAEHIEHALSISTSLCSGLIEANRTGGSIKPVHCGWAAHAGLTAAEFARAGLTGAPTAFEGRFGFIQAFVGEGANLDALTTGLGVDWELLRVFYKPYPTNHFTHAGVDAALELRRRGLRGEDLAEVRLGVPGKVLKTIAEPADQKARPTSPYTARFSGPFTFATAMLGGGGLGVYLDDFTDDSIADEKRLELAARVRCVADSRCDAVFPTELPAIVSVRTVSGQQHEVAVMHNRGGPHNPLSSEELRRKFNLNASRALSSDEVATLDAKLECLPDLERLDELLGCASGRSGWVEPD